MEIDSSVAVKAFVLMSFVMFTGSIAGRLWPFGSEGMGPTLADTLRVRVPHILILFLVFSLVDGASVELGIASLSVALAVMFIHWFVVSGKTRE